MKRLVWIALLIALAWTGIAGTVTVPDIDYIPARWIQGDSSDVTSAIRAVLADVKSRGNIIGLDSGVYLLTDSIVVENVEFVGRNATLWFQLAGQEKAVCLGDNATIRGFTIDVDSVGAAITGDGTYGAPVCVGQYSTGVGYSNITASDLTLHTDKIDGNGIIVTGNSFDVHIQNIMFPNSVNMGRAILLHWGNTAYDTTEDTGRTYHPHNIDISNISIDTLSYAAANAGIFLSAVYGINISNVQMLKVNEAINVYAGDIGFRYADPVYLDTALMEGQAISISNVYAARTTGVGFVINGNAKTLDSASAVPDAEGRWGFPVSLSNSVFRGSSGSSHGILLSYTRDVVIYNCDVSEYQNGFATGLDVWRTQILSSNFTDNQQHGISLNSGTNRPEDNIIRDCYIANNRQSDAGGYYNIYIGTAHRTIVDGCRLGVTAEKALHGIQIDGGSAGNRILNNYVYDVDDSSISVAYNFAEDSSVIEFKGNYAAASVTLAQAFTTHDTVTFFGHLVADSNLSVDTADAGVVAITGALGNDSLWIKEGSQRGQMVFRDSVTGEKTLAQLATGGGGTVDSFMVDLTDSWTPDSTWITPDDTLHLDTTAGGGGTTTIVKLDTTGAGDMHTLSDTHVWVETDNILIRRTDATVDSVYPSLDTNITVSTVTATDSITSVIVQADTLRGTSRITEVRGWRTITGADSATLKFDTVGNLWTFFDDDGINQSRFYVKYQAGVVGMGLISGFRIGEGDTVYVDTGVGTSGIDTMFIDTIGDFSDSAALVGNVNWRLGANMTFTVAGDTVTLAALTGGDTALAVGDVTSGPTRTIYWDTDTGYVDGSTSNTFLKSPETFHGWFDVLGDTSIYGNFDIRNAKFRYQIDTGGGFIVAPFHDSLANEPGNTHVWQWNATNNRWEIAAQTGGAGSADSLSVNVSGTEYDIMSDYVKLAAGSGVTFTRTDVGAGAYDSIEISSTGGGGTDDSVRFVSDVPTNYDTWLLGNILSFRSGYGIDIVAADSSGTDTMNVAVDTAALPFELYVARDGTDALTGDWDVGDFRITTESHAAESLVVGADGDTVLMYMSTSGSQTGQLVFRDSVSGEKTLAELVAGAGGFTRLKESTGAYVTDSVVFLGLNDISSSQGTGGNVDTIYMDHSDADHDYSATLDGDALIQNGTTIDWNPHPNGGLTITNDSAWVSPDTTLATAAAGLGVVLIPDGSVSSTGKMVAHVVDTSILNMTNLGTEGQVLSNATGGAMTWITGGSGETNTLSDTGTFNGSEGFGLAGGKTGVSLKVKGLIEGSGITITADGDSAYSIAAGAAGGFPHVYDTAGDGTSTAVPVDSIILQEGNNCLLESDNDTLRISFASDTTSTDPFVVKLNTTVEAMKIYDDSAFFVGPVFSGDGADADSQLTTIGYNDLTYSPLINTDSTGTGSLVRSASPTISGTVTATSADIHGADSVDIAKYTDGSVGPHDIDSTGANYVFDEAYKITGATADSAYATEGMVNIVSDTAQAAKDSVDLWVDGKAYTAGDVYTGNHDFGGATRLEIPHDNDPTTTAGDLAYDDNDHGLEMYDGATAFMVALRDKTCQMTIDDPDNLVGDTLMMLTVDSTWAPHGITITAMWIKTWAASTYSVVFAEYTAPANGNRVGVIETVATSTSTEARDDAPAAGTIEGGNIVCAEMPATDVQTVTLGFTFYINAGN